VAGASGRRGGEWENFCGLGSLGTRLRLSLIVKNCPYLQVKSFFIQNFLLGIEDYGSSTYLEVMGIIY
jgi:hypothetical protein